MSSSQIPNLLETLRASRSARGGRGSGRNVRQNISADAVVQQTDDDAAGSRLSAVQTGYLFDPFAQVFSSSQDAVRRMPIINRGTYVRTTAIDQLVDEFIDKNFTSPTLQFISLGAGTDTRFFRYAQQNPTLAQRFLYHELDFPQTTAKKVAAIERTPSLVSLLKVASNSLSQEIEVNSDRTSLQTNSYFIHPLDLRSFASAEKPEIAGLDSKAPTIILSEMCLTYLPAETSSSALRYLSAELLRVCPSLEIVMYEPLQPSDAFGRTMVQNLGARGITLAGLHALPTLEAHLERLKDCGFGGSQDSWTVKAWWDTKIDAAEKDRLRRCEMVDEEEEWILLAEHYGFVRCRR